jgi:hypothetical protein
MNTTLSTQHVRLLVLVALLAVCGLAYFVVVPRNSTTTTQSPARTTVAPTVTPRVTPAKPTIRPVKLATHGLPVKVAKALQKHRVVVVVLYAPGSKLDEMARAESLAGARNERAGFVALDVFRQKEGNPILHKLGVVDTPAVLVVSRPAHVYAKLPGVSDRTIVEQAVSDARG